MRIMNVLCFSMIISANTILAQEQLPLMATFVGENRGDKFGTGLTAGDFSNDGFSDILIGAGAWKGGNGIGKDYLYWGSENIDDFPDAIFTGDSVEDYFDFSLSAADVNGDDFVDFAIPASGYDKIKGKVEVYYGDVSLDAIPDIILRGQIERKGFGTHVSMMGDVNGDTYPDMLVTAAVGASIDQAFIYLGGVHVDTIPYWSLINAGMTFTEAEFVGDVNGDGFGDVLIQSEDTPTRLYFGGAEMDTIPDVLFYEASVIGGVGDVNFDGFDDVVIGFSLGNPDGTFLFFGSAAVDTIPDLIFLNHREDLVFARDVASGDINGDGYPDIILGQVVSFGTGAVWIYVGGPDLDDLPEVAMFSSNFGQGFGTRVISAGDVNGDGADDLLVSDTEYLADRGIVYLFSGDSELPITGVEEVSQASVPERFRLLPNAPNPFSTATTFRYELKNERPQAVQIVIYNILGEEVIRLIEEVQAAGKYEVQWDGRDALGREMANGLYFCHLLVGRRGRLQKILLMR